MATLRHALGLRERSPGEYVTVIEPGSDALVRLLVDGLTKLKNAPSWKVRAVASIAAGLCDALVNGIKVTDGAADWAAAIVEAVEE